MILTDYYRFERLASKAKSRMDCTFSTRSYPEFEERAITRALRATEKRDAIEAGDIIIYYNDVPTQFAGIAHRKADKSISIKGSNLSSIYVPDITKNIAYGDFKGTTDALLFVFTDLEVINGVIQEGSIIEIFVARGKSKDRVPLFDLFAGGELDEEMSELKSRAKSMRE